jgi:hypothetical protein
VLGLGRELRGGFTVTVDGQSAEATAASIRPGEFRIG